jgi:VIT1/CCC1 family predicted Fe2+/Mn2+ transporter
MEKSYIKESFGFGLASGVITTLGLMIGLYSSTYSRGIILGGILTIAIADAFSDAVGIHFSEEVEGVHTTKEIWVSTIITFFSKFIISLTFLIAVLLFPLKVGIFLNILWSFLLVGSFSFYIAKKQKNNPYKAICEHFLIMIVVIAITYYVGKVIDTLFLN